MNRRPHHQQSRQPTHPTRANSSIHAPPPTPHPKPPHPQAGGMHTCRPALRPAADRRPQQHHVLNQPPRRHPLGRQSAQLQEAVEHEAGPHADADERHRSVAVAALVGVGGLGGAVWSWSGWGAGGGMVFGGWVGWVLMGLGKDRCALVGWV